MKSPKLSKKILRDPDLLGAAIEMVLMRSKAACRVSRKLRRSQGELRDLVGDAGWAAYLRVEDFANWRAVIEGNILVKWAFEQGRQRRRR